MSIFSSKNFLIIAGIVLMLSIDIAIVGNFKLNNTIPNDNVATDVVKEIVTQNKTSGDAIKIVRVIDGDTIEIAGGEKIRYIGIDAPETVDPRKTAQCFGREASRKNKELVEGKMARLEKDVMDRDKYHRLLRYVWVGNTFVNLALVQQGFAYSYSYPPDIKYQHLFIKAQQEAMKGKHGLWRSCGY